MVNLLRNGNKTAPARDSERPDRLMIPGDLDEGWEVNEMHEREDFTRQQDPTDGDPSDEDTAYETKLKAKQLWAANAWFRAMELLIDQGFETEDCEAEIMRRCARKSRAQRAIERRIQEDEAEYGVLDSDESRCNVPFHRLCPEHGDTLIDTRRGVACSHDGCERRWAPGHKQGHCDLPAVVVMVGDMKARREYRLCAGHRLSCPDGTVLRTLPRAASQPTQVETPEDAS